MSENRISPEDAYQLPPNTPLVVRYYEDGMRTCAGKVISSDSKKETLKLTIWPSLQAAKIVTLKAADGARIGVRYTMVDEDLRVYDLARPNEVEMASIELRNQNKTSSIQGDRKKMAVKESETIPGASTEVCDSCGKPVVVAIRIPNIGVFCNKCAKKNVEELEKEKENKVMTSEAGTATAPEKKTRKTKTKAKAEVPETVAAPKKRATKKAKAGKAEAAPKGKAKKGKAKATKRTGPSKTAQILALMQRKGGATKAEMQKITPNSASSTLLAIEKRGIKVKRSQNKEGYTVYSVKA